MTLVVVVLIMTLAATCASFWLPLSAPPPITEPFDTSKPPKSPAITELPQLPLPPPQPTLQSPFTTSNEPFKALKPSKSAPKLPPKLPSPPIELPPIELLLIHQPPQPLPPPPPPL
ncbi:proline-rich receptor-like protein kinase PERK9 [Zingiber officinale]|uniref:proline-rich receptor-like protein kinase PERK9 n=1 Tax=Zingiber officinale TaxID=94328 RepID=UPI001C4D14AD|nr:proline-rich receptor-like protein kinase PERK9 [Zingiber officinale]